MKKIITVFTVISMMFMLTACAVNPRLKSVVDDYIELEQTCYDYTIKVTECKTPDEAKKLIDEFDMDKFNAEYEYLIKRIDEITKDINPTAADRKYVREAIKKIEELEEERKTALREFFESNGVDIPEGFEF